MASWIRRFWTVGPPPNGAFPHALLWLSSSFARCERNSSWRHHPLLSSGNRQYASVFQPVVAHFQRQRPLIIPSKDFTVPRPNAPQPLGRHPCARRARASPSGERFLDLPSPLPGQARLMISPSASRTIDTPNDVRETVYVSNIRRRADLNRGVISRADWSSPISAPIL
jgi:hypothetical protein